MKYSDKIKIIQEIRNTNPEIASRLSAEHISGDKLNFILYIIKKYSNSHRIAYYDTGNRHDSHIRTKHIAIYPVGCSRPERNTLCERAWKL